MQLVGNPWRTFEKLVHISNNADNDGERLESSRVATCVKQSASCMCKCKWNICAKGSDTNQVHA